MIDLLHYKDKTVAVLGLGRTGTSVISALTAAGAHAIAWDDSPARRDNVTENDLITLQDLRDINWQDIDRFVLSPGIPLTYPAPHPSVKNAIESGVRPVCDIELLFEACPNARYIGITGTNGKSTTTALIGHILKKLGQKVQIGGNIGAAALTLDPFMKTGTYVLELSSYQLELLEQTHFNIAVLLNITPEHLDRHGSLESYVAAKMKIFDRQQTTDTALIGIDDPLSQAIYEGLMSQNLQPVFPFSSQSPAPGGVYIREGRLFDDLEQSGEEVTDLSEITALKGAHNWQNAAAAYLVARLAGERPQKIVKAMESFEGLAHRQEIARQEENILFINDSKATNALSAAKALSSYTNIHWIAGGQAKKDDLEECEPYYTNVKQTYLIGEAEPLFAKILSGKLPTRLCKTLATAIEQATANALAEADKTGERQVVLLSPACASWDQFDSFEHRGDTFKQIVKQTKLD